MRRALALLLCSVALGALAQRQGVRISASPASLEAAARLDSLLKLGGCPVFYGGPRRAVNIHVGRTPAVERHCRAELEALRDDGYLVVCDGRDAYLCGAGERGTLYAVYAFLERLGYRLYTPTALKVPDVRRLRLPACRTVSNPAFAFREIHYPYPNSSRLYAEWHHLDTRADRLRQWGMYVHTFQHLVPPARHFDAHPEWFSLAGGRRLRDGQLCLSNPEVLEALCRRLADTMAARPEAAIWSVSPNDNYNACQCAACLRLDSLYGGPAGTLTDFVNRVARRFPGKTFSTLAYQYSRRPGTVRPDSNVVIMLCPIESGREAPIVQTDTAFVSDLEGWHRLTGNIYLWDYVVQFRNFWNPFPNLHVLQPNLQFFAEQGVRRVYEQGSGPANITSWMDIRCYMLAKLMWDPYVDIDSVMDDFYAGYYGAAAPQVKEIIASMTAALVQSGQRLDIYGYPVDGARGYLSAEAMRHYRRLMREAAAAAGDSAVLERLRFFGMALDFAQVELAYGIGSQQEMEACIDSLEASLLHFGVPQMMEMGCTPAAYAATMRHWARKRYGPNLARGKAVSLRRPATPPYDRASLADGVPGMMDYRHHWLGFWGDTLDAVVDLGQPTPVGSVSIDFFLYPLAWIFLPQRVQFAFSRDGEQWHWQPASHPVGPGPGALATPDIHTERCGYASTPGEAENWRYVRVVAVPPAEIPAWHRAAGQPPWLFADELVVE